MTKRRVSSESEVGGSEVARPFGHKCRSISLSPSAFIFWSLSYEVWTMNRIINESGWVLGMHKESGVKMCESEWFQVCLIGLEHIWTRSSESEWDWAKFCESDWIWLKLHEAEQICLRLQESEWVGTSLSEKLCESERICVNLHEAEQICVRLQESEWVRANLSEIGWIWVRLTNESEHIWMRLNESERV